MWLKSNPTKRSVGTRNEGGTTSNKRVALNILKYFKEYCNSTGVHGLRYLSEEERSGFEKLFWATAIAISAFGCLMMITMIKTKMDTTPMIVTMAENPTDIWHIPFPAMTICPGSTSRLTAFNLTKFVDLFVTNTNFSDDFYNWVVKSKNSKDRHTIPLSDSLTDYNTVFNESSWLENSTLRNSLFKKLWALNIIRNDFNFQNDFPNDTETLALDEADMEFLLEVSPKMNTGRDFEREFPNNFAFWKLNHTSLEHHFRHLWTDQGLCFTFNMMDNSYIFRDGIVNNEVFKRKGLDQHFPKPSNDWDPDRGYTRVSRRDTYPWRAPHEKQRLRSLLYVVMMEIQEDIHEYWGKGTADYMIMFHQPQDHPLVSYRKAISLPFHKEMDVVVEVDVMTTSPELETYAPHKRQCYYSYEKHLMYFKFYSQSNCELECVANVSLRMCGCISFFFPRFNTTKICGTDAYDCLSKATLDSDESAIDADLKYLSESGKSPFNLAKRHSGCDCLPSCLSISYEAEVLTATDFATNSIHFNHREPTSTTKVAPSAISVSFKNKFFTASQRSEYYGQLDFLANCGGFLGLFCGFSILSFIEIIYFLTIRLWTNIHRCSTSNCPSGPPKRIVVTEEGPSRITFVIPSEVDSISQNTRACKSISA